MTSNFFSIIRHSNKGQATVEFAFVFVFVALILFNVVRSFTDLTSSSYGNLAHVLSRNLIIGVCPSECFFAGYRNGYEGQ